MNDRDQNNKNQSQDYIKPDEILPGTNKVLANNLLNIGYHLKRYNKLHDEGKVSSWENYIQSPYDFN